MEDYQSQKGLIEQGIAYLEMTFGAAPCIDLDYENDITKSYPTFLINHKNDLELIIKGTKVIIESRNNTSDCGAIGYDSANSFRIE